MPEKPSTTAALFDAFCASTTQRPVGGPPIHVASYPTVRNASVVESVDHSSGHDASVFAWTVHADAPSPALVTSTTQAPPYV